MRTSGFARWVRYTLCEAFRVPCSFYQPFHAGLPWVSPSADVNEVIENSTRSLARSSTTILALRAHPSGLMNLYACLARHIELATMRA